MFSNPAVYAANLYRENRTASRAIELDEYGNVVNPTNHWGNPWLLPASLVPSDLKIEQYFLCSPDRAFKPLLCKRLFLCADAPPISRYVYKESISSPKQSP